MLKKILASFVIGCVLAVGLLPTVLAQSTPAAASPTAAAASTSAPTTTATAGASTVTPTEKDSSATEKVAPAVTQSQKEFAEYRPLIGGKLLPGVGTGLGEHRVDSDAANTNSAFGWLRDKTLKTFANILLGLSSALAVVMLVIGSYQYLTAMGEAEQIKHAHKTITWTLVGLGVMLVAFAVVQVIVNLQFTGKSEAVATPIAVKDYCPDVQPVIAACPLTTQTNVAGAQNDTCDTTISESNNLAAVCALANDGHAIEECTDAFVRDRLLRTPRTGNRQDYYSAAGEFLARFQKTATATVRRSIFEQQTQLAAVLFINDKCTTTSFQPGEEHKDSYSKLVDTALALGLAGLAAWLSGDETKATEEYVQTPPVQGPLVSPQTPFVPSKTDYCLNIAGIQESVPSGYQQISANCYQPSDDLCSNIDGIQFQIPSNLVRENGECLADVCSNLAGAQPTIPEGMTWTAGVCATSSTTTTTSTTTTKSAAPRAEPSGPYVWPTTPQKNYTTGTWVTPTTPISSSTTTTIARSPSQTGVVVRPTRQTTSTTPTTNVTSPIATTPVTPIETGACPMLRGLSFEVLLTKLDQHEITLDDLLCGLGKKLNELTLDQLWLLLTHGHISFDLFLQLIGGLDGLKKLSFDQLLWLLLHGHISFDVFFKLTGLTGLTPDQLLTLLGHAGILDGTDVPGGAARLGLPGLSTEIGVPPDTPSTTDRTLDATGPELFDRPILLLASLTGLSEADRFRMIVPCDGGSNCSSEVDALPKSDLRDELLPTVARFLIYASTSVAVIIFFVAGAMLVLSEGEAEVKKKAYSMIIWGVVGLAFAAAAYILVRGTLTLDFGTYAGGTQTTTPTAESAATQSVKK